MLLPVKSFEIFPKHNGYGFVSEPFALNWYISVASTNKKMLQNDRCNLEKLVEYFGSLDIVVSFINLCVGHFPRSRIPFFWSSIWTDELFSTPKVKFAPRSKLVAEKSEW